MQQRKTRSPATTITNEAAAPDPSKGALSSPDLVAREIVRGLYQRRYVPGQRLIEADLTRDFNVSRGSVREALRRLAGEGVVTLNLHQGAYIRRLTEQAVRDVLRVHEVLTGLSAREAAERIDEGNNRAVLSEAFELLQEAASRDYFEVVRARNRFFRTVVVVSGNDELARVIQSTSTHFIYIPYSLLPAEVQFHMEDCANLIGAIFSGNPDEAEELGRQPSRRLMQAMDKLPSETFPLGA